MIDKECPKCKGIIKNGKCFDCDYSIKTNTLINPIHRGYARKCCPVCIEPYEKYATHNCPFCGWIYNENRVCKDLPFENKHWEIIRKLYNDWIAEAGEDSFTSWCRDQYFKKKKQMISKLIISDKRENKRELYEF